MKMNIEEEDKNKEMEIKEKFAETIKLYEIAAKK